jgi:hypothetical protein
MLATYATIGADPEIEAREGATLLGSRNHPEVLSGSMAKPPEAPGF